MLRLLYSPECVEEEFLPVENPVMTVVRPPQEQPPKGYPTLR